MENIPDFFIKILHTQYSNDDINKILNGMQIKRKLTLRINTIKSNLREVEDELKQHNISYTYAVLDNALIIENSSKQELESLSIYNDGKIYLQSLSSMIPPIILNPHVNMDILDMCAAPGGKTTQLAALANNEAHITACEMNHIRLKRLKYNIEKQGATCVYIMQKDARNIDDFFLFDSILLDAPCSGSGTINVYDNNIKKYFTEELIKKTTISQFKLLNKALKILKPGKEMIYSTCSILQKENEDIINEVKKENAIEIIPIDFIKKVQIPTLPTKIDGTVCICPNELYEGFFIAKIRKVK